MHKHFCIHHACAARIGRTPSRRISRTINRSSGIFRKIQHTYVHTTQYKRAFFVNDQFRSRCEDSMLSNGTFPVIEYHCHVRANRQHIISRVYSHSTWNFDNKISDRSTTINGPIAIVGFLIVVFHYPCIFAGIHIIHDKHSVGSTNQWYSVLTLYTYIGHIYMR